MSAKPDYVVSKLTRPTGAAATGGFVINLTSSTTPMALSQPKDPTLAQYTFFVSRRREDGRERFRLHMGYFETMQAAEEMLSLVREVYPQAWAGEAPGKNLRPRSDAAAAKPAAPPAAPRAAAHAPAPAAPAPVAAAPAPKPAPVAAASVSPPPAAAPERHPFASMPAPVVKPEFDEPFVLADGDTDFKPIDVPVVHPPAQPVSAAPVARAAAPKPAAKPAPAKPAAAKPAAKPAPAPAAAKPAAPAAKAAPPKPAAKPAATKPAPAKPPVAAPKIAAQVSAPALQAAAPKPAPVAAAPAPKAPPPEPTVQMPALRQQPPAAPMSATPSLTNVRQVIEELDDLSDTQTIRLLERHSPYREGSQEASVDEAIQVIKPEDAQSMAAIKSDVKRNAPVLFAVQLDWSVTPFDMGKVPPLAIFNAYTLYTTEANREGRTWYGLRLGFFSDAVSAKQVAYYVRSDFKTVSVVPVTTIEKERATDINAERSGIHRAANVKEGPAPTPASLSASTSGIFKLLEDDMPAHIEQDVDGEASPRFSKPAAPAAPPPKAATPPAAAKSRKPPAKGNRRDAHARVDEETLDQTLEILGAHTLEITNDGAGDTGVRHLRVKVDKKGSKFASLIDRLSGKK
jgi:chemotaxis protein histidine kinase CheA